MTYFRRRKPTGGDTVVSALIAAGAAVGAALVVNYMTRLFLCREPLPDRTPKPRRDEGADRSSAVETPTTTSARAEERA